jgi:hypothetical protein
VTDECEIQTIPTSDNPRLFEEPAPSPGPEEKLPAYTEEFQIVRLSIAEAPPEDIAAPMPAPSPELVALTDELAMKTTPIDEIPGPFAFPVPIPEPKVPPDDSTPVSLIRTLSILETPLPEHSPVPIPAPLDPELPLMTDPVMFNSRK